MTPIDFWSCYDAFLEFECGKKKKVNIMDVPTREEIDDLMERFPDE